MSPQITSVRCDAHEKLVATVAGIEANIEQILITVRDIDSRLYAEHGDSQRQAGAGHAAVRAATIATGIGAAVGALVAGGVALLVAIQ